eukprot:Awhi_evm1s14843
MLSTTSFFSLLVIITIALETIALTPAQQTAVEALIDNLIDDDDDEVPKLVRLSFHDCVGGCDGCINLNNPENNGLGPIVDTLE